MMYASVVDCYQQEAEMVNKCMAKTGFIACLGYGS